MCMRDITHAHVTMLLLLFERLISKNVFSMVAVILRVYSSIVGRSSYNACGTWAFF